MRHTQRRPRNEGLPKTRPIYVRVKNNLSSAILVSTLLAYFGDGQPINLSLELDTRSRLKVKSNEEKTRLRG